VVAAEVGKFNISYRVPAKFFVVRFHPGSRTATLAGLPIPETPKAGLLDGMAVSPSGTELAVGVQTGKNYSEAQLSVYSLTTRAVRSWRGTGQIGSYSWDSAAMSWSRSGTLAFNWFGKLRIVNRKVEFPPVDGIWLLNTSATGGRLLGRSRHAVRPPQLTSPGLQFEWDGVLTPEGTKIVAAVYKVRFLPGASRIFTSAFEEFSAATGRRIRILDKVSTEAIGQNALEWTNSSGSVLVVDGPTRQGGKFRYGVLSGSRFITLPKAPPVTGIVDLAF
jgi:hypothetical protein